MHQFLKFTSGIKLYLFQTVTLSIIRSFSLYTGTSWSHSQAVSTPVWHTPLLCVQWKTPNCRQSGQRNCLKHIEFYSKYKFEKLVHLVGFIIRSGMLTCTFRLLYPEASGLSTHWLQSWVGTRNGLYAVNKRRTLLLLPAIVSQFFSCPSHTLITIQTKPPQLPSESRTNDNSKTFLTEWRYRKYFSWKHIQVSKSKL